jgi:hypothetical protein
MTDPAIPVKPPARVTYEINKQTFSPIAGLLEALKRAIGDSKRYFERRRTLSDRSIPAPITSAQRA